MEWNFITRVITELDQKIQGNVIFTGISFDFFDFIFLFLMTIGIFLILLSSTIVYPSLIGLQYLQ